MNEYHGPDEDDEPDMDDEDKWDDDCPYCGGIGETLCDIGGCMIGMECPECGGTGVES